LVYSFFEDVELVFFVIAPVYAIADVLGAIMVEMASLTESGQVTEPIVSSVPVNVSYGEDHLAPCVWVRLVVVSPTPFTFVACPMEPDQSADQGPFGMIFGIVDRHDFRG
jgi:hypothetical protein